VSDTLVRRCDILDGAASAAGHLQCPFCMSYDVARLYLASARVDACDCATCGMCWDEQRDSGRVLDGIDPASVIVHGRR
jgi:hypothetical protein